MERLSGTWRPEEKPNDDTDKVEKWGKVKSVNGWCDSCRRSVVLRGKPRRDQSRCSSLPVVVVHLPLIIG